MQTFAEQFAKNGGAPIEHDGRQLHWTTWLHVKSGDELVLRFLRAVPSPVQGLGLEAAQCQLTVGAVTAKHIALWADTAPKVVSVRVTKAKPSARIGISNQWRDEKHGSTMYRLNNAAMEVQPQPDRSLLLRCSDGWGPTDFSDLVVHLIHTSSESAEA